MSFFASLERLTFYHRFCLSSKKTGHNMLRLVSEITIWRQHTASLWTLYQWSAESDFPEMAQCYSVA